MMKNPEPLYTVGKDVKKHRYYGTQYRTPQEIKIAPPYDAAIPLLGKCAGGQKTGS